MQKKEIEKQPSPQRLKAFKILAVAFPFVLLFLLESLLRLFNYGHNTDLFVNDPAGSRYLEMNYYASDKFFSDTGNATKGNHEHFAIQKASNTFRIFVLGESTKGLSDKYADYWEQNLNHTLINRAYCVDTPKKFKGYGENCWGLTASDNYEGYNAHSPTNDLGVISPTAALSAFPYTPKYSVQALRHFYYDLGDKIWGEYGFTDAFSESHNWYATSYLAIDQGPIVVMIENYRSGLLWKLFMSCPEVQDGLKKLDFKIAAK